MRKTLKKWQMTLIIIAAVLVIIGVIIGTLFATIFREKHIFHEAQAPINLEAPTWYIGTKTMNGSKKLDAQKLFATAKAGGGAVYSSSDNGKISVSGDTLTVNAPGKLELTVTSEEGNKTYSVEVIKGVNVFTEEDVLRAAAAKSVICQQADIALETPLGKDDGAVMTIENNYYGNGCKLVSGVVIVNDYYRSVISVTGEDVLIRDLHIIGEAVGGKFTLDDFGRAGFLISFQGGDGKRPSGTVEHCALENAQRPIFVNAAEVTVRGCYIRNAADAAISVESNNRGATLINLENNVIYNAVVAGVLSWTYSDTSNDNFAVINISGFLDIYNWKNSNTAQIMPASEGFARVVNPMLSSTLNDKRYDSYFLKANGLKYVHCGIVVTSTSKTAPVNKTQINGYDALSYVKRDFPLPSMANGIMTHCNVYGYGTDADPFIKPDTYPNQNDKFYEELLKGRIIKN